MADLLVDNPPVAKKKSKKKKRKAVSPNEPDTLDQLKEQTEKYPKVILITKTRAKHGRPLMIVSLFDHQFN
jgi:hypothetical protein